MNFDNMTPIQRRLHNAAIALGAEGDEHGFEALQRDAIDEIERLRVHAVVLAETARQVERERCAKIVEEHNPGGSYHIRTALAAEIRRA